MKKLNGYRPTHRNRWKLLSGGILSLQELSLLEYYADIVDFDKNHDKFGYFEVDFSNIKENFVCSENTVRSWHNRLLLLGFIEKSIRTPLFKLICHARYLNPGKWGGKAQYYQELEKDQPIEIILQSFGLNLQSIEEKLQQVGKNESKQKVSTAKNDSIAIGSSKVEYKDSYSRTFEDYRKIKKEGGYKLLTEEDMKWIDENIYEGPTVPS